MTDTVEINEQRWLADIIIRPIRYEDLPGLEWDGEYRHFRNIYRLAYQRSLRGHSILWVVELPGTGIIGQVFIQVICDRLELADGVNRAYFYSFRIRPQFRGYGIGSRVLQVIEADLRSKGFRYLMLNVAKTNQRARALYERAGYVVVAHEPGIWSYTDHRGRLVKVHEPAWRMEKEIGAEKELFDKNAAFL